MHGTHRWERYARAGLNGNRKHAVRDRHRVAHVKFVRGVRKRAKEAKCRAVRRCECRVIPEEESVTSDYG